MLTVDLEHARRLQIGRRHELTFISFYLDVQKIMRGSALLQKGCDSVICHSQFRQGFKTVHDWGITAHLKETKSFKIRRDTGNLSICLKEPDK